jgi:hypothetical protein
VNDIVTPYDLTSYAKDALKNYVPGLVDDADEIGDGHPARFTERGFTIDHSPERDHGFCWRVPQAGRGNAFWIPLRVNPAQRELWHDLLDGDADVGQFRLQSHRSTWELHVTVEYEVAEPDHAATDDDVTRSGSISERRTCSRAVPAQTALRPTHCSSTVAALATCGKRCTRR